MLVILGQNAQILIVLFQHLLSDFYFSQVSGKFFFFFLITILGIWTGLILWFSFQGSLFSMCWIFFTYLQYLILPLNPFYFSFWLIFFNLLVLLRHFCVYSLLYPPSIFHSSKFFFLFFRFILPTFLFFLILACYFFMIYVIFLMSFI